MILVSLLAFLPAVLIGVLTVLLAWPSAYRRDLPLKIALGMGIGPGITSCLYFLFCLVMRPRSRVYWLLELSLLIALCAAAFLLRKKKPRESVETSRQTSNNWLTLFLIAALAVVGLIAAASFTIQSLMQPHGIQDAWNIWNMRARFLFRGGPDWKDLFSPAIYWLNHPDYPFLVTAGSARAWSLSNSESTSAPAVQAGIYAFALLGVIFTGLGSKRSWGQGALAALLLASSAWFVLFGAWQIADIPLDFFYAAAIFLLILILSAPLPTSRGILFLFGLAAGLAAWSKNEGNLFLVIVLGAWVILRIFARPSARLQLREIISVSLGLLLPFIALLCLKILAPPNDLFIDQTGGSLASRLSDLSRYSTAIAYIWQNSIINFSGFAGWNPFLLALLVLFALLQWPATPPQAGRGLWVAASCLALLGLGYFAILIITPHDLLWHLRTAANRLLFHLYPPGLIVLFWALRTPEQVVNQLRQGESTDHAVPT